MNRWVLRTLNLFSALFGMMVFFPAIVVAVQLTHLTLANWAPDAPQILLSEAWWSFGLMIGISLIGRLLTWMLDDLLNLKPVVRRVTTIVLALLTAYATRYPAAWIFDSSVICAVMMIFGFFAFWNGSSLYFRTYHQVLTLRGFIITSAVNACILAFMFGNQCNPFGTVPYALILLIGLLMMVIGMNQGGIDTMMNMRRHRLDQLPPKIRIYNLKLTGLMTGVMLLSVVFYNPLSTVVRFVGILLREGFGHLLMFLFAERGNETVSYDYSVPPDDGGDPPIPPSSLPDAAETPIVWDILLYSILIAFAILFILFLPKIIRALVRLVRELSKRIKEALHANTKPEKFASDEYVDIDETVEALPETFTVEKQEKPSTAWRNWRQQYRKYSVMEPGTQRIREGYRLLKAWLLFQEVPLQPSDTTLDIVRTADLTLDFVDLDPATQQYNLVRYGDVSYDLCNPHELDKLLGRMAQTRVAPKLSRLARIRKEEALR
ncbi:MAG: hypothetical protein IJY28_05700 [Clostridia bacterium]|nr:hypothetical protein [Clostridia bacterium]